jgi:hypothetical protein
MSLRGHAPVNVCRQVTYAAVTKSSPCVGTQPSRCTDGKQTSDLDVDVSESAARVSDESDGDGAEQEDKIPYSRAGRCACDSDIVVDTISMLTAIIETELLPEVGCWVHRRC